MSHLDDWAAALVDAELSPPDRDRVLAHLAGCAECRVEVDAQRRVKARLGTSPVAPPSDALTARLLAGPTTPAPSLAASDVARRPAASASDRPRGARPWPGRRTAAVRPRKARRVAAGSVGVLAAALTVAMVAGGDAPGDVAPPVGTFVVEHTATTTQLPLHDPVAGIVMISTR